ncbi:hypothetical protein ACLMYS_003909 [Salmonella enterica]
MGNYDQARFESFLFTLHKEAFGEPTLRATKTQVFLDWQTNEWVRDSEDQPWKEIFHTHSEQLYGHSRGFAVQAALQAFTEWQKEYQHDRDQAGYDQQQHDLAVEKAVERWFEEGIRS